MPDRGKLIRAMECCAAMNCGHECPYVPIGGCRVKVLQDALALLKAQTGQWIWDRPHHFRCSGCGGVIGQMTPLYCPNCGREMGLEERERKKEWPD